MKNNSKKIVIYIICFLISFVVTVQIRTIRVSDADILRLKNENELRDEVVEWKGAYNLLATKVTELNKIIDEYRNEATKSGNGSAVIKKELNNSLMISGMKNVSGKGLIIKIDDSKAINKIISDAGYTFDNGVFLINSNDIITIINELKLAGAEAISINGQRITNSTGIKNDESKMTINAVTTTSPYEIKVIGDYDTMQAMIEMKTSKLEELKSLGIEVEVEKNDDVLIPEYSGANNIQYMKILEEAI